MSLRYPSVASVFFLFFIIFILVTPPTVPVAYATGMGLYFSAGLGESEFDEEWSGNIWADLNTKGDSNTFGGGLVFDTAVAKNKLFNYRLNIGYEKLEYKADSIFNDTANTDITDSTQDYQLYFHRVVLDNTFGFGVVRNKNWRLWIGPQIRLGYQWGNGNMLTEPLAMELELDGFLYGIAPVVGANIHIAKAVSIGFDSGYRFNFSQGNLKKSFSSFNEAGDYKLQDEVFFINFFILYRFNDQWSHR